MNNIFFYIILFLHFNSCLSTKAYKIKEKNAKSLNFPIKGNCGDPIAKMLQENNIFWCDSDSMSLNTDGYFFEDIKEHLNVDFISPIKNIYYFKICDTNEIGNHCFIYIHDYKNNQIAEDFKNKIDSIYRLKVTEIDTKLFDAIHFGKNIFIAKDSLLIYFADEIGDTPCARVKKVFKEIK